MKTCEKLQFHKGAIHFVPSTKTNKCAATEDICEQDIHRGESTSTDRYY